MANTRNMTVYIAKIAVLSALAYIMYLIEFVLPLMPPFLKIDFSEVPVLLATFALGPASAVIIEMVKNLLHLFVSYSAGIGELANFIVGVSFAVPAGLIYSRKKDKTGAVIGLIAGIAAMAAVAALTNYYVFIPLYGTVLNLPVDTIIGMSAKANKMIVSLRTLIAYGIIPFNLIKGIAVSIVVVLVYKKLSPLLHMK